VNNTQVTSRLNYSLNWSRNVKVKVKILFPKNITRLKIDGNVINSIYKGKN